MVFRCFDRIHPRIRARCVRSGTQFARCLSLDNMKSALIYAYMRECKRLSRLLRVSMNEAPSCFGTEADSCHHPWDTCVPPAIPHADFTV